MDQKTILSKKLSQKNLIFADYDQIEKDNINQNSF